MCGIVGGLGPKTYEYIHFNLNLLHHRGPDSSGILRLDNGLTLGATRLAMTDPLERSNQPMIDPKTNNILILNGEIYNFKALKHELISLGFGFDTESDTEVALKYLVKYGPEGMRNFEGMFALSYFDSRINKLYLARDYLGKKPLYYSIGHDYFIFCSRIELIRKFLNKLTLDEKSISTYLSFGYVMDPLTMYKEIKSLEPGNFLTIDLKSGVIEKKTHFFPRSMFVSNEKSISETLTNALIQRVEGHKEFALSLSGGIDSSILLMKSIELQLNVCPFTLRWSNSDKKRYNIDSDIAIKVTKMLKKDLEVVDMPESKYIPELLTEFVRAMDEPNANPTGVSMMVLYNAIKKAGHRLVITGDGSDEIFGGYERYNLTKKLDHFPKLNSPLNRKLLNVYSHKNMLTKIAVLLAPPSSQEYWMYWHVAANFKKIKQIFDPIQKIELEDWTEDLDKLFTNKSSGAKNLMFRDLKIWLAMESNKKLDRVSMWHSVEARSPFQSENVINIGYKNMEKFKFKYTNKELLKFEFPQINQLPLSQRKMGFISPLGHWLRENQFFVDQSISNISNLLPLNKKKLRNLSYAAKKGNFQEFKLLWSLVVLNSWINENH